MNGVPPNQVNTGDYKCDIDSGLNVKPMKKRLLRMLTAIALIPAVFGLMTLSTLAQTSKKLLVVTVTKGFRHSSIPTAEKVLGELAKKDGSFTVDYVRNDQEMACYDLREEQ